MSYNLVFEADAVKRRTLLLFISGAAQHGIRRQCVQPKPNLGSTYWTEVRHIVKPAFFQRSAYLRHAHHAY
jgi:hypothetical protein